MLVRYFAAACAAAGVEEEHLDVLQDRGAALSAGDVVDVLPPFAGG